MAFGSNGTSSRQSSSWTTRFAALDRQSCDAYPIPQRAIDELFRFDHYEIFNALIEGALVLDAKQQYVLGWAIHAYAHSVIGGSVVDPKDPVLQTKILGTMDSIPSSPYDPFFWLNHANVDRLWAEWQDQGHTGETFYPSDGMPFGHNLHDPMWPWDRGLSTPGEYGSGNLRSLLLVTDSAVIPADVLDYRQLGYTYDTIERAISRKSG
ncbi:tyrosinase family protein [Rubidibacter lacunae]|uniref:tyrosinase family protein n=1 Tax=Rubidibacter lacunae TaxID=582514 RepID=UPI0008FEDCFC|nr:tyrosinase family protein [Rubidibacter lacunae]